MRLSFRAQIALLVALSIAGVAGALLFLQERAMRAQIIENHVEGVELGTRDLEQRLKESYAKGGRRASMATVRDEASEMLTEIGAEKIVISARSGTILAATNPELVGRSDHEIAAKRQTIATGRILTFKEEETEATLDIVAPLDLPGVGRVSFEAEAGLSDLQTAVGEAREQALVPSLLILIAAMPVTTFLTTRFVEHARARERRAEERFRSLAENSADVIALIDSDGSTSYVSPAVERILGYSPLDRMGRSILELVHPDDQELLGTLLGELLAEPGAMRSSEVRIRHQDNSWRWIEGTATNLVQDPRVEAIVLNYRDVSDRKRLEQQLTHQAFHDPLTHLANRALFKDRVQHALSRRDRDRLQLAVMFMDLDDFKTVNDSLGHEAGDKVLVEVAERLRANLRPSDTGARLGGDEFALLVDELSHPDEAGLVAERALEVLEPPFNVDGRSFFVRGSIGIAVWQSGPESAAQLLRNADVAMYRAKVHGKRRYEIYEATMHAAVMERLELKADLERALENDEFEVHYQPIVALGRAGVVASEALVRWHHPKRGLVAPNNFIPLAEDTGLIVPLGNWVLREACRQTRAWQLQFPSEPPLSVAVNLSGRQFELPRLTEEVAEALRESGLAPGNLTLELTESLLMEDTETTLTRLRELKGLGVGLAVDDFGTGYSSLAYLQQFPIDRLKIDKRFIDPVALGTEQAAIARAVLKLADSLGLRAVAEGIEKDDQVNELIRLGCEFGQGYYFSKPLRAGDMRNILASRLLDVMTA